MERSTTFVASLADQSGLFTRGGNQPERPKEALETAIAHGAKASQCLRYIGSLQKGFPCAAAMIHRGVGTQNGPNSLVSQQAAQCSTRGLKE